MPQPQRLTCYCALHLFPKQVSSKVFRKHREQVAALNAVPTSNDNDNGDSLGEVVTSDVDQSELGLDFNAGHWTQSDISEAFDAASDSTGPSSLAATSTLEELEDPLEGWKLKDLERVPEGTFCLLPENLIQSLQWLQWKKEHRISNAAFKDLIKFATHPPQSLYRIRRRLQHITGLVNIPFSCCVNSCCAQTMENAATECRCTTGNVEQKYHYFPIIPRLLIQWSNPGTAKLMKEYPRSCIAEAQTGVITDFWDADLFRNYQDTNILQEERDMAFSISMDGVTVIRQKGFSVWPMVVVNLNLPPSERTKRHNMLLLGFVPGPREPKLIETFLQPFLRELTELEKGIRAFDGHTREYFRLRGYLCVATGDSPAIAKMMMMRGGSGKAIAPCRFCLIKSTRALATKQAYYPHTEIDLLHLPYRKDMKQDIMETIATGSEDLAKEKGYSGISCLLAISTLHYPGSFGQDPMHLFSNVTRLLLSHWRGEMPQPDFGDQQSWVLPESLWTIIGEEMISSCESIPTALSQTPRSIHKSHKSFKAKEFESWTTLFSVPLLYGRLPDYCLDHWKVFAQAVRLTNRYEQNDNTISKIRSLFRTFVYGYEQIYYQGDSNRLRACTSQIHGLLHIADCLSVLGPAFVFSQWSLESFVGTMESSATSKSQINASLYNTLALNENLNHLRHLMPNMDNPPWEFTPQAWRLHNLDYGTLLGPVEDIIYLRPRIRGLLNEFMGISLAWDTKCKVWQRYQMIENGPIFTSNCSRQTVRRANLIEYNANNFYGFGVVDQYIQLPQDPEFTSAIAIVQTLNTEKCRGGTYITGNGEWKAMDVASISRMIGVVVGNGHRWICTSERYGFGSELDLNLESRN